MKSSSSPSVAEPISLHGARSSNSSIVPSVTSHESVSPLKFLHADFFSIQLFDFGGEARGNRVALQFAVRSEQAILDAKGSETM